MRQPLRHQRDVDQTCHSAVFVFLEKWLFLSQVKNISSIKKPMTVNNAKITNIFHLDGWRLGQG